MVQLESSCALALTVCHSVINLCHFELCRVAEKEMSHSFILMKLSRIVEKSFHCESRNCRRKLSNGWREMAFCRVGHC